MTERARRPLREIDGRKTRQIKKGACAVRSLSPPCSAAVAVNNEKTDLDFAGAAIPVTIFHPLSN